jgi:neutral ceramidase
MSESQLLAGTSVADITPPLEVGLLTSSVNGSYEPFESVRLPLKARILVIRSNHESIAIVSLDLLSLNDTSVGGWDQFKQNIAGVIEAEKIIICYTHTHSAPESGAISDLYLAEAYRNWLTRVQQKIKQAIEQAFHNAVACNVALTSGKLEGYSLQRRIKTDKGIVMSDSVQPIAKELLDLRPVDRRIRSVHFHSIQKNGVATMVHAICHPVHEMCMPHVSSEFPGEMCNAMELSSENGMPLFLNGAAGDTNPPTVSMGARYAQQHGVAIAGLVKKSKQQLLPDTSLFAFVHDRIQLKIRQGSNVANEFDALARISAVRVGSLAMVFLPGEPFVETALEIEDNSPFEHTIVVGFSENNIGYVPTEEAFNEGGYEIGPGKWSFLEMDACRQLKDKAIEVLKELYKK